MISVRFDDRGGVPVDELTDVVSLTRQRSLDVVDDGFRDRVHVWK